MSRMPVKRTRLDKMIVISLVVILVVWIFLMLFLPSPPIKRELAYQDRCRAYMRTLAIALVIYAGEYNNMYPTPEKWCDLLIENCEVPEESFLCHGRKGNRCDYAMNPNCKPNSPEEMVLLFESTGGWNQFGGSKLLNIQNHNGKGCHVVFNDGHVEFVETEELEKLRWKVSEISGNE